MKKKTKILIMLVAINTFLGAFVTYQAGQLGICLYSSHKNKLAIEQAHKK